MRPGGGRAKGAAFERELAQALRSVYPGAERGLGQARGGAEAADVEGTPYWIQGKHGASPRIEAAYEQGVTDRTDQRPVVAITRRNRGRTLVTMALGDWLTLCAAVKMGASGAPGAPCGGSSRGTPVSLEPARSPGNLP